MPIYKGNNEVTSSNLYKGSTKIENGYKEVNSFYVNELPITALGFSSSSIGSSGGNTNFVVTGANGATYTLSGSGGATAPSGIHTISGSSDTQVISISANTGNCAPSRTPRVTVSPVAPAIFSPSNLTNYDTISQAASPNCVPAVTLSGQFQADVYVGSAGGATIYANTPCNWSGPSGSVSNSTSYNWSLQASSTCGGTTSGTVYASPISSSYASNSATVSVYAVYTYGPFTQSFVTTNIGSPNPSSQSIYRSGCSSPGNCEETGVNFNADTTGAPGSGVVTIQYVMTKSGCPTITRTRTVTRSTNSQLNIECYLNGTVTVTAI